MDQYLGSLPDLDGMMRVLVRLAVAAGLGGLVGVEREWVGKAAGLRTHMTVSLGAAVFVLVPLEMGIVSGDLTRVVQGIATGIGFIGAGTILKRRDSDEIEGLTTAASIWLVAAIGLAVGAGQTWLALASVATAWIILTIFVRVDRWLKRKAPPHR